jgi:hypothetical protein
MTHTSTATVFLALLFSTGTAQAADTYGVVDAAVIGPKAGSWYEGGVGAPSATVTRTSDKLVMVFESQLEGPTVQCPTGRWGVGIATSSDARTWAVRGTPLVADTPGSWHDCGAREPTLVVEGDDTHIWFVGLQDVTACEPTDDWACEPTVGIGHAVDDSKGTFVELAPALVGSDLHGPDVVKIRGTYEMIVGVGVDLWGASSLGGGLFVLDAGDSLTAGVTWWALDELHHPSVLCRDGDDYEWSIFWGGCSWDGDEPVCGWGEAVSDSGDTWFVNPEIPYHTTIGDFATPLAVSAVRVGDTDGHVAFFERLTRDGRPVIGMVANTVVWTVADLSDRVCE